MDGIRLTLAWLGGLAVLAGCQSPYYSQPYQGGYALPPGAVPQGTYLGPTGVPQGAMISPGPTVIGSAPAWQPTPATASPTPASRLVDSAPAINNPPATSSVPSNPAPGNRLVPDYPDTPADAPAARQPRPRTSLDEEDEAISRPQSSVAPANRGPQLGFTDDSEDRLRSPGDDEFPKPQPVETASSTGSVAARPTSLDRPNPYDFDRKKYSWLRGVVSFDDQDKTWRITYDPGTLGTDLYGGNLALVPDDLFETILADDVLLVKGYVDPDRKDRYQKPMYRVTEAWRCRQKKHAG